jgi:cyclopropane fatty-acyl-phospholipid synthase-like methyltransferase
MKNLLLPFLNPVALTKAYLYHRKTRKYNKSVDDLELTLYSKIFRNDMLHFGYFDDIEIVPEFISIGQFEIAQKKYAEIIIEQIGNRDGFVLDVGCGMGGISYYLLGKGYRVEALTPNQGQSRYINRMNSALICHHCKFEDFSTEKKFGTVIHSESLQYKVEKIILPDGKWIITDIFRIKEDSSGKSGHQLVRFIDKIREYGWSITYERDITLNVLPTLKMAGVYVDRMLLPAEHYLEEKLRFKKAWLYYLTKKTRSSLSQKVKKQLAMIDPEVFLAEKKYMLFVLQKL